MSDGTISNAWTVAGAPTTRQVFVEAFTLEQPGPGLKFDSQKARTDLLPADSLALICQHSPYETREGAGLTADELYDDALHYLVLWRHGGDVADLACAGAALIGSLDPESVHVLSGKALRLVVQVLEYGARKYSANNWQQVENGRTRYYAAALRHLFDWSAGESPNDPETGLDHRAHALCCVLFLLHVVTRDGQYIETDECRTPPLSEEAWRRL